MRRIITYIVTIIAIAVLATIMILLTLGYRLDKDHHLAQGGLVQFATTPSGAQVWIDGSNLGSTTSTQSTLAAGQHEFSYSKQGYHDWKKTLDLKAGSILWLNYARLVPNKLTPSTVATFSGVGSAKAAPDNTMIALIESKDTPKISLQIIKDQNVKAKEITLPADSYTPSPDPQNQTFTIDSWSPNSRYLLVKHTYNADKVEWLRVDSQGDNKVINLTNDLALDLDDLTFRPSNADQLYALSGPDKDLRRINLIDTTISAPLAQNVANYSVAGDGMITYVTASDKTAKTRTVGYVSDGSTKHQVLRTFDGSDDNPLFVASGLYYDQRYVAISDGSKLTIFTATLPDSAATGASLGLKVYTTQDLPFANPDALTITTHGRFVSAEKGGRSTLYDLELDRLTSLTFENDKHSNVVTPTLGWLDNYVRYNDANGMLQIQDFDGTNLQTIMPVVEGLDATLNPNGKYLYGFTKKSNGEIALARVQMILD